MRGHFNDSDENYNLTYAHKIPPRTLSINDSLNYLKYVLLIR